MVDEASPHSRPQLGTVNRPAVVQHESDNDDARTGSSDSRLNKETGSAWRSRLTRTSPASPFGL
jgi:hypothetical protein